MTTSQNNSPITNDVIAFINLSETISLSNNAIAQKLCKVFDAYKIRHVASQLNTTSSAEIDKPLAIIANDLVTYIIKH